MLILVRSHSYTLKQKQTYTVTQEKISKTISLANETEIPKTNRVLCRSSLNMVVMFQMTLCKVFQLHTSITYTKL